MPNITAWGMYTSSDGQPIHLPLRAGDKLVDEAGNPAVNDSGLDAITVDFTDQTEVTITHDLDTLSPSVVCYDSAGVFWPDAIVPLDANRVRVSFAGLLVTGTISVRK